MAGHDATSPQARIEVETTLAGERRRIVLSGPLTLETLPEAERRLAGIPADRPAEVDAAGVTRLDTAGAWSLGRLRERFAAADRPLEIAGLDDHARLLLDAVGRGPDGAPDTPPRRGLADRIEALGRGTASGAAFLGELTGYLGLFVARLLRALLRPRHFRLTALVAHCEDVGVRAIPIVTVMAFLIGVVLAFQGAAQLRQFGAEVFVVDLIAISILRELGILLTAIIVAGRTASAFTAAIGSMKMREEIDAMRTLGLDPADELIVPRVLALLIMLPILGLVANVAGLVGGALMSWLELGISPAVFRTRLVEGTDVSHVIVGLVKAPVFAVIIGIVGCHAGMQVGGNAESLGRRTSGAVVTAIFAVIVADAVFSIFFAQVGI